MRTFRKLTALLALCAAATATAGAQNTGQLSENGWYSDDTRADGTGTQTAGTNLISPTLTDDPEATSGTSAHDADINGQIVFASAPGTVPSGTHWGAVNLNIAAGSGSGKSQASHRKDDGTGHATGADAFGSSTSSVYSWMGDGTVSVTSSLKLGVKTSEFGSTGVSTRTGENVWDKVLIYEPGNLNGNTSDGLWHTETVTYTSGKWWFFDRTAGASIIGTPMTLSDMSTSAVVVGGGPKTVADVYALITAAGAHVTSIQFGIGSGNAGGNVYVNELTTSYYRAGSTTTFGPTTAYDEDVTPDVIFGSGNINGSFAVDRQASVELGLRGKLRYPASNIFNSNGDGTYTFSTGSGTGAYPNSEWSFEFAVNTDYDGGSGQKVGDLTYEMGMDNDPSAGTDYLVFDPISIGTIIPYTVPAGPVPYWDHSMGDNSTANGAGVEAGDGPTYAGYLTTYNVAQNSWRPTFYQNTAPYSWDPDVPGAYQYYLAAFDGGTEVGRTAITIYAVDGMTLSLEGDPCQTDQDGGTAGIQIEVELWLRNPDDMPVTGYQAFLAYDDTEMTYEGGLSTYSATPFEAHIQAIATAMVASNELRLDGNTSGAAYTGDALLATLVFTVTECDMNSVAFDLTQAFNSEASYSGTPYVTDLLDSSSIVGDITAPVLSGTPADITQPADAGSCTTAVVTWVDPTATDNCDPSPTVACSPASGSTFPVGTTTVTCTATDACGNESSSTFDVTVTATNTVVLDVQLVGTGPIAASRCIHFVMTDDCGVTADITLPFDTTGLFSGEIEVPCGVWTGICAKDQQHTEWDSTTLSDTGAKYVAAATLDLDGGDTDDDGDVDINDVTLFLVQFGTGPFAGGCPWDGTTRDADFSNNGAIGSEDYTFLVTNWLTLSSCSCIVPLTGGGGITPADVRRRALTTAETSAADLNRDGWIDWRDVVLLERRNGLPHELSNAMRTR